jgi:hypothetical protein
MVPDYRAGISVARGIRSERTRWFADTTMDGLFVSRYGDDFLVYVQSRLGYAAGSEHLHTQIYWSGNFTLDSARHDWANFIETGPGLRFTSSWLPPSMYLTFNTLRGAYLTTERAHFTDLRTGVWYAFTR